MTEPLYRIGEAARLLELETYVLRFWETEFTQLEPLRTPKGQRLYTGNHLDLLKRVKALLYDDGLTIEGARKALAREAGSADTEPAPTEPQLPKVVRPAKPARFVQGTLLPRPTPVVRDSASIRLLQDLRCELGNLQALVQAGDISVLSSTEPSETPSTPSSETPSTSSSETPSKPPSETPSTSPTTPFATFTTSPHTADPSEEPPA